MVVTLDTKLPTEDELTMPELKLSGPALRAGAFHLGKYCQDSFNVSIYRSISIRFYLISFCIYNLINTMYMCIGF